jgi:hypothetical protein
LTISSDEARQLALALPGAVEQDHHGRPSFRVDGKIFATLWDERTMNVMIDHDAILTAVQARPDACAERWWGKRLAAVSVSLDHADAELLAELLADAREHKGGH